MPLGPTCSVLCLGEILYDCIADQVGLPLAAVESWTAYPGGAPANVACALTKLGTPTGFIGRIGGDSLGQALAKLLQETGVNTDGLQIDNAHPTRTVMVLRSATGDRAFAAFGDNRPSADFADAYLKANHLPYELFEQAKYLVLGTLGLACPDSAAAIEQAIAFAQQHNVQIFLDVNWRPVFWPDPAAALAIIRRLLPQVNWLKLSDDEAEWLFGTRSARAISAQLPHLKGVLITAGERGCEYKIGERVGYLPAFEVDVEDTTGAGDSFVAGVLHQLCRGGVLDADEMVRYASAVGALTTVQPGAIAAQPTSAAVEAFLLLQERMAGAV
jgi:fructokinase